MFKKNHKVAEGDIIPFIYDFFFERDMVMGEYNKGNIVQFKLTKEENDNHPTKKPTHEESSSQAPMQLETFSLKTHGEDNNRMKQVINNLPRL
jgi:hypothetical protein